MESHISQLCYCNEATRQLDLDEKKITLVLYFGSYFSDGVSFVHDYVQHAARAGLLCFVNLKEQGAR